MDIFFGIIAIALLLLSLPYLGRVIAGPSVFDRLVGFNGIGTKLPLLLVLLGLYRGRVDMFVDFALSILLLNFFTTMLIARHIRKRGKASATE